MCHGRKTCLVRVGGKLVKRLTRTRRTRWRRQLRVQVIDYWSGCRDFILSITGTLMPVFNPDRPWATWYGKRRWKKRSAWQLKTHPLCIMCLNKGFVIAARVADHIEKHNGDVAKFWSGPLQSLCAECHSSSKRQIEDKGFVNDIGADGWPIDPNHSVYK